MNQDTFYRDTVAEIDLDAIRHNIKEFQRRLPSSRRLMAAVKADAYGHGAVPVSMAALDGGATDLGVAFLDEALELRAAGIQAPILVLGYTPERGFAEAIQQRIALTVYDTDSLRSLSREAEKQGEKALIHLKLDTGMGRIGLWGNDILPLAEEAVTLPGIEVEGLYTHFATADDEDKRYTHKQHELLMEVVEHLAERGVRVPLVHCSNSAASIDLPEYAHAMIRVGISLYGYYPSAEVDREAVNLRPAMTLKTRIVHLKQPEPGTGISYGRTHIAREGEWVATLPVGYADGLNRSLSNRGHALVGGKRVPIIGRICMDQTMLDVTDVMPVQLGDEVVLYGTQGSGMIHVDEIAQHLDTISYEVTCWVGRRVPRVYLRNGQVIGCSNLLGDLRRLKSLGEREGERNPD
ncbi:alanine racemase [Salinithrix halophila]|uniref:Alanine racemase n=1 Tax=Salinithrix halophila TaxID=1485204 RepID=A0ABV8JA26_9BACL